MNLGIWGMEPGYGGSEQRQGRNLKRVAFKDLGFAATRSLEKKQKHIKTQKIKA